MSNALPVSYGCFNCPSYCCSYPRIPVTKRDIARLAKHFAVTGDEARERFTKPGWTKREMIMRHQEDETKLEER